MLKTTAQQYAQIITQRTVYFTKKWFKRLSKFSVRELSTLAALERLVEPAYGDGARR